MRPYTESTFQAIQKRCDLEPSRLWFEVIMQGMRDILAEETEAREWLDSDDFEICCNLAGAKNQHRIRQMIEQALRNPITPTPR